MTLRLLAVAAILAGIADAGTFSAAPLWLRSADLGLIPRLTAEFPVALLAVKVLSILGIAWLGWLNRDLRSARVLSCAVLALGAAYWTFGAVVNVAVLSAVR